MKPGLFLVISLMLLILWTGLLLFHVASTLIHLLLLLAFLFLAAHLARDTTLN